jgi:hypothetical protein
MKDTQISIPQLTQADYLLKTIDDTIRELQLRRAEILAGMPVRRRSARIDHLLGPGGKKFTIKGRKS